MAIKVAELSELDKLKEKYARILSKVKETREAIRNGVGTVVLTNINPDYAYCWVNVDQGNQTRRQAMGYEIVDARDAVHSTYKNETTGQHRRGDTVLMRINREQMEVLQVSAELEALEQVSDPKDAMKKFLRSNNLPEDLVFTTR